MLNKIKENKVWATISGITIFSVLFYIIVAFVYSGSSVNEGFFDKDNVFIEKRELWIQNLFNFLFFTFLSNFMIMVLSILRFQGKTDNKWYKIVLIMGAASITMTMIVYWTILFNWKDPKMNAAELLNTIMVHFIAPVAFVSGFVYDGKIKVNKEKLNVKTTTAFTMIFPCVWLSMSLIIYYSLGGTVSHSLYGFLHHNGQSILTSTMYIFGIAIAYGLFSFGFIKYYNKSII